MSRTGAVDRIGYEKCDSANAKRETSFVTRFGYMLLFMLQDYFMHKWKEIFLWIVGRDQFCLVITSKNEFEEQLLMF